MGYDVTMPNRARLLFALLMPVFVGFGGCNLYFEEGSPEREPDMWPDDCSAIEGCDSEPRPATPDASVPDLPPTTCETNEECAEGCYCSDTGTCEESGFCRLSIDCASDFECSDLGTCVPSQEVPPPATCIDLSGDEAACLAAEFCGPVYRGVNCTSDTGEACTSQSAACTCESFSFDSCEEV